MYQQAIVASVDEFESDFHTHSLPQGNESFRFPAIMPRDRWVCVEMFVRSAEDGLVELYWDGVLIASGAFDTRMSNRMTRVNVGFVSWRSGPRDVSRELYVDEVVVDTQRFPV